MCNYAGGCDYFHAIAGVCLCIITLVILIIGYYLITILIKIKRIIRDVEETVRKVKAMPFQMVCGFMSGFGKIRDFFTRKSCKNEKKRREE